MSFAFFCNLSGGAGEIRGRQMAVALGGRFNPPNGYQDDACVFIAGAMRTPQPAVSFHDILDCGYARMRRIQRRTTGDILAVSQSQHDALVPYYAGRQIHLVPQHHCNFARERIPVRPVTRVGVIGGLSSIQLPEDRLIAALAETGLTWMWGRHFHRRSLVVQFYRALDIQVIYRPTHPRFRDLVHLNPLKVSNAGSFGIPTVAYPEVSFVAEWGEACLWATSFDEVIDHVRRLQADRAFYDLMASRALERAETYHIEHIAECYRGLPC